MDSLARSVEAESPVRARREQVWSPSTKPRRRAQTAPTARPSLKQQSAPIQVSRVVYERGKKKRDTWDATPIRPVTAATVVELSPVPKKRPRMESRRVNPHIPRGYLVHDFPLSPGGSDMFFVDGKMTSRSVPGIFSGRGPANSTVQKRQAAKEKKKQKALRKQKNSKKRKELAYRETDSGKNSPLCEFPWARDFANAQPAFVHGSSQSSLSKSASFLLSPDNSLMEISSHSSLLEYGWLDEDTSPGKSPSAAAVPEMKIRVYRESHGNETVELALWAQERQARTEQELDEFERRAEETHALRLRAARERADGERAEREHRRQERLRRLREAEEREQSTREEEERREIEEMTKEVAQLKAEAAAREEKEARAKEERKNETQRLLQALRLEQEEASRREIELERVASEKVELSAAERLRKREAVAVGRRSSVPVVAQRQEGPSLAGSVAARKKAEHKKKTMPAWSEGEEGGDAVAPLPPHLGAVRQDRGAVGRRSSAPVVVGLDPEEQRRADRRAAKEAAKFAERRRVEAARELARHLEDEARDEALATALQISSIDDEAKRGAVIAHIEKMGNEVAGEKEDKEELADIMDNNVENPFAGHDDLSLEGDDLDEDHIWDLPSDSSDDLLEAERLLATLEQE